MIGIIDYNCGNIASVVNMVSRLGYNVQVIHNINDLNRSKFLILPGVGNFSYGMKQMNMLPYREELLHKIVKTGIPTLGICMGMQLLTAHSEEGGCTGLDMFDLKTIKFPSSGPLPHMGWSVVNSYNDMTQFTRSRFYFVHNYFVEFSKKYTTHSCEYNGVKFSAAIQRNNIMGCQFHPEKSHKFGMQFFDSVLSRSYE